MAKYCAIIVGAGRIGAGYNWHDDEYTHAGAYRALKDRVELVGFVDPVNERAEAAEVKWGKPCFTYLKKALEVLAPDIVSICTQPEDQFSVLKQISMVKGIWCEKPWASPKLEGKTPVQVNYLRHADSLHRMFASKINQPRRLVVYGKDDIHTRCHFDDLSRWWLAKLDYRTFNGPCSYLLEEGVMAKFFDNGGINPGECMKGMLANLLDHIEGKAELWSPPA